jgi:hypothetical protein
MPVLNPEAFWNTNVNFFYDDGDGIPLRLKPDSEPRPGEYSRRVIRVAHRLRELLEELRRDKSVKRAGSLAGTTVFLARKDTESAIEKEWLNVRAMLLSEGANVVPTPANTDVSPEADVELLQRADLFVQLFSALDSLNDAKAQLKAAEAESEDGKSHSPSFGGERSASTLKLRLTLSETFRKKIKRFAQVGEPALWKNSSWRSARN